VLAHGDPELAKDSKCDDIETNSKMATRSWICQTWHPMASEDVDEDDLDSETGEPFENMISPGSDSHTFGSSHHRDV
jgi:hypothetical protein